jgi:hypothetical protein
MMKVMDIAAHMATPPHRGVGDVCTSLVRTNATAPNFVASVLTNGVIK